MPQTDRTQPDEAPEMVHVPAGPFTMGTSHQQAAWLAHRDEMAKKWLEKGYFRREQPQHTVTLGDFWISKHPVTVGEYRAFVSAGGYQRSKYWTEAGWIWRGAVGKVQPQFWEDEIWSGYDKLPVVGVSWYEVVAYSRWLSEAVRERFRLPSEAEWEKAARGTDGRLYPWGDAFDSDLCNTRASGLNRTEPVGARSPRGESPYGCAEMGGNSGDWTLSQYKPYPYDGGDGRNDVQGGAERVIRGGSWFKPVLRARAAARGMNDPFFADDDVGFRLVCEG